MTDFRAYFDRTIEDVLEDNDTVHDVLASLQRPTTPPIPMLGDRAWRALRIPIARMIRVATIGLLPPVLRERCGLRWTGAQERELRALAAASRAATPVLPKRLRHVGPDYLRLRDKEISRTYGPAPRRAEPVAA
jgi:uncharacterized protein (DUF2236 family)